MLWPAAWQSTTFVTDDAQSSPHGAVIFANATSLRARHAGKKLYMELRESFEVMVATDLQKTTTWVRMQTRCWPRQTSQLLTHNSSRRWAVVGHANSLTSSPQLPSKGGGGVGCTNGSCLKRGGGVGDTNGSCLQGRGDVGDTNGIV